MGGGGGSDVFTVASKGLGTCNEPKEASERKKQKPIDSKSTQRTQNELKIVTPFDAHKKAHNNCGRRTKSGAKRDRAGKS